MNIFVGNLSPDTTEEDLQQAFSAFGQVKNVTVIKDMFSRESKGFGFIKEDNSQKDYFVHSSGLKDVIRENDKVTFDLEMGKKGLNAVNVKLA